MKVILMIFPTIIVNNFSLEPDLLAATKALKSSRRRERIVRNVQKATERVNNSNNKNKFILFIQPQSKKSQDSLSGKILSQPNHFKLQTII